MQSILGAPGPFLLGATLGGLVTSAALALVELHHRQTVRLVLGFSLQALSDCLTDLRRFLPDGPAADQLHRCLALCHAVHRVVNVSSRAADTTAVGGGSDAL